MKTIRGQRLPGLKEIRRSKNMSQRKLAEVSGYAQANISLLETGKHGANYDTAEKLAAALQVSTEDLMRNPDSDSQTPNGSKGE